MSDNKPEISGASIILLGSFNPSIFQPMWFAAHNLISKQEGESAGTRVVHAQVSSFSVGDWLELQVTEGRFAASTLQEPSFEPLCDLVLGTFQLLRHTPIQKMGLNREFHFRMSSEKEWNKVGDRLAPKPLWDGILEKPGMRRLVMKGARPDELKGAINVTVEPSTRVEFGVYLGINDHYEPEAGESVQDSGILMDILKESWKTSVSCSDEIAFSLLESILNG